MPPTLRSVPPCVFVLAALLLTRSTFADDLSAKQKAAAAANLKVAGLKSTALAESEHFIVCAPLPPAKVKQLAESLEKVNATARKALQYEPKEEPWKGKLTVYVFDERRPYTMFMLQVAKERSREAYHLALRSEEPFIVRGIDVGQKLTDAETFAESGKLVAAALMTAKVGAAAQLPDWVKFGFGNAVVTRAGVAGAKSPSELRSGARTALLGGKGRPPARIDDAWSSSAPATDILPASLMDYLAFGPTASQNFSRFLTALRPSEDNTTPSIETVLMSMMWPKEELEKGWKKFVLTGK